MKQAKVLENVATFYGDRPAISVGTEVYLTYRQFADRVARLAGALRGPLGLAPGDRVGLAMKNCGDYYPIEYGVWHGGLASVPINAKLHPREIAYILENSGARVCLATADLAEDLAPLVDEIDTLEQVIDISSPIRSGLFNVARTPSRLRFPGTISTVYEPLSWSCSSALFVRCISPFLANELVNERRSRIW